MMLLLTFAILILCIGIASASNSDLSDSLNQDSDCGFVNQIDDSAYLQSNMIDNAKTESDIAGDGEDGINDFYKESDDGTDTEDDDDNNGSETGVLNPELNDTIDDTENITPGTLSGKTYINIYNEAFEIGEIGYLPITYDLRDYGWVTPVKDQSSSGSCWAFASTAALESFLLKTEGIEYDFSENNMKNIMGSYSVNGTDFGPNDGGNEVLILAYFLRWDGPINETDDPYNPSSTKSPYNLTRNKYVQDVLWVPKRSSATDNDQVKWALMNYGALYTGIYWDSTYEKDGSYYYYGTYPYGNHAITIVGWDDTYSASNFKYKPAGDGAFLIKNSWGTADSYGNEVGIDGYYYVSYYDTVFCGMGSNEYFSAMAFTNVENTSYYKSNYYYDVYGNTFDAVGYKNETAWFANQFESTTRNPLKAVGFYSYGTSAYTANIYVNNNLKYTQSGTVKGAGYHTVKLDSLVDLDIGDIFKIAIKLTTPNCDYPIAIETYHSGFTGNATASANQSFVSSNGIAWQDLTEISGYYKANVCLKAYTGYAADLVLDTISNVSYYSKGDEVELVLNLTNRGDLTSADVYSQLDENVKIISYEATSGTFDPNSKIWTLSDLDENSSNILRIVIQINTKQANITNSFFVNSSLYNMNQNSSSMNLFKRVSANLTSEAMSTSYNSGELFDVTIVDEDEEALNDVEVCFRVYDSEHELVGTYYNTTDDNGRVFLITDFNAGSYSVEISLVNPYYEGELIGTIVVSKSRTELKAIDVDSILNKTTSISANVISGSRTVNEGTVSFYVNGVFIGSSNVIDGTATIDYIHNKVGGFEISANYNENNNYYNSSDSASLNVEKITAQLKSDDIETVYKDLDTFDLAVLDENNNGVGNINVQFNIYQNGTLLSNNFITTDSLGMAKLPVDLKTGIYTIEANILDEEWKGINNNTVTINKATGKITAEQNGFAYGNSQLIVIFSQAISNKAYSNQSILASFSNGRLLSLTTDEEGKAILDLDFVPGYYTFQLSSRNSNIIGKTAGSITILKEHAVLSCQSITKYYQDSAQLTAILKDVNGNVLSNKTLCFAGNGKEVNVSTDSNGQARLKMDFVPGTYSVSIGLDDEVFECENRTASIKVLPIPTKIVASNLNVYYNAGKELSITLSDNSGKALANKQVRFTINGKTYVKNTNTKGVAKLAITQKVGTYKVAIAHSAVNYASSSKTVTVKVLKPKISLLSKTVKKGKKLTVIFKDANGKVVKGKKVVIKIGKKTYSKTTNKKGRVSIKITLKKGKYSVTSGFAKNSGYGTATQTAKITVK